METLLLGQHINAEGLALTEKDMLLVDGFDAQPSL